MRNRALPPGMRVRNGYYSWTAPDGREFGLGRDREAAIAEVAEAMIAAKGLTTRARLVDRLSGSSDRTLGAWMDVYEVQLAKRKLAANTQRSYKSLGKRALTTFGESAQLSRITTLDVANALTKLQDEGKSRLAQSFRSYLTDLFRAGVAAGWIDTNPVLVTERISVEVMRARLTLDVYLRVRDAAGDWLRNAMDLALVSGQGREEIAAARFADFYDDHWHVVRKKTKVRLRIPMALRLDAVKLSLGDVVKRCRATGVLSHHLIHQTQPYGNSPPGQRIWIDTISRRFTDALEPLNIDFGDKTKPTFHEIRSLAARLYAEQGGVNTQHLLGHSSDEMTQTYRDSRGAEWLTVKVG